MQPRQLGKLWRLLANLTCGVLVLAPFWADLKDKVFAQSAPVSESAQVNLLTMEADLSHVLEAQARILIERHLRPEEFQVLVTVEGKLPSESALPYVPLTFEARPLKELSPAELKPFIKKVEVEILLAERFKPATKDNIEAILTKKLALDKRRGDQIRFSPLGMEVEPPRSDLAQALSKAEAETRDIQAQLSVLTKERDDVKRELSSTKTALETIQRSNSDKLAELIVATRKENAAKPKEAEKQKDDKEKQKEKDSQPKQEKAPEKSLLEQNLPMLTTGALILVALLLLGLIGRMAASTLAKSFSSIGDAVRAFGEKVAESVSNLTPATAAGPQSERKADAQVAKASAGGSGDGRPPGALGSIESIQARILALRDDLLKSLNPSTESIILTHIARLLESDESVVRAVVTMEFLGRDKANEFFQLLDAEAQSTIREFMRSGVYNKPKVEIMLEAAEELKTKLLTEVFGEVRGKISEQVASRILRLKAEGLAVVANALNPESLPRLFLYFNPRRLAEVLSALRAMDREKYSTALKSLPLVPSVETRTDLDADLITALNEQIASSNEDILKSYLNWYKAIADSLDQEVAEELRDQLASASPQLERYVRDQMITFGTFFILQEEIQQELIEGLSNKNLAALTVGLDDQRKAQILTFLDKRRQELVVEEEEALKAKGQRQATQAHRQAKNLIVASVKALKGSGTISDFVDKNKDVSQAQAKGQGTGGGNAA